MSEHAQAIANPHEIGCTGYPHRKILMWLFLASDCMFFGALITTYLVYRGHETSHPLPREVFDLPLTATSTVVLLLSSLFMVLALAAIRRGDLKWFRVWCGGTALFGSVFLGFQIYEFQHFVMKGLTLWGNLFGSTFYVLTGTHGCHVAVGVLWLWSLFIYSFIPNGMTRERALDVETVALYWHFVDIVWIVIFTSVYLFQYLI